MSNNKNPHKLNISASLQSIFICKENYKLYAHYTNVNPQSEPNTTQSQAETRSNL